MNKQIVSAVQTSVLAISALALICGSVPAPVEIFPEATPAVAETTPESQPQDTATPSQQEPNSNVPITHNVEPTSGKVVVDTNKQSQSQPEPIISPLIQEYVLGDFIIQSENSAKFPIRSYETSATPNDPHSGQWWESSLNLPQAWDFGTGSSDTTLAIIDTGFALDHEEFQGRWHINTGESGLTNSEAESKLNCSDQSLSLDQSCNLIDDNYDGIVDNEAGSTASENPSQLNCSAQGLALNKTCNLVDDDSNGLVDDWRGWDFVSYDNSVQAGDINPSGNGTRHGSYVAGVAAANANNGVGIAGVNWQTKILPIQALSDDGSGNTLSVARAIRYAVDQGADVISLSLGSSLPDAYLRQAITDAIAAGVIVVAASGNDGCNCISYPANYIEVVAVGALAQNNTPASFSSYGSNLDILAPGVGLYTASWSPSNQTSAYASYISGTSLATPLVSAALTTLKSHRPDASATELVALLSETTDRLSLPSNAAHSSTLGFGTANLNAAISRATTPVAHDNVIGLTGTSNGSTLFSTVALEKSDSINAYKCSGNKLGTTPVYRLSKGSTIFYSTSSSEAGLAQANGFSSRLLGYFCVVMPHDSVNAIRRLNVFAEFENQFKKQP